MIALVLFVDVGETIGLVDELKQTTLARTSFQFALYIVSARQFVCAAHADLRPFTIRTITEPRPGWPPPTYLNDTECEYAYRIAQVERQSLVRTILLCLLPLSVPCPLLEQCCGALQVGMEQLHHKPGSSEMRSKKQQGLPSCRL